MDDTTRYEIYLNTATGLIFYWSRKSYRFEGTYQEVLKEFNKVQRHNKIFGWWSGLGPFVTMKCLNANKESLKEVKEARTALGLQV